MNLADHLDKLHAFKVIAVSGKMRVAAKKLNVTQPSLTRLVQSLETATGANLFSRSRQGVVLTDAGQLLLTYTNSILKSLGDLEQMIKNPNDILAGHLRIGAYSSLAEYLWPDFILAFKKLAPNLRLSIHSSEVLSHKESLEQGKIDILVDAEPRLSEELISWELYEDRFNFYTAKKKIEILTPQSIGSLALIYSPLAFDRNNKKITQHLEEKGYFFNEIIELDSFTSVMAFAKKGLGLAVLPQRLAEVSTNGRQLHLFSLDNFSAKGFGIHNFTATIHESRKDDPRIRFLIRHLREWFKK